MARPAIATSSFPCSSPMRRPHLCRAAEPQNRRTKKPEVRSQKPILKAQLRTKNQEPKISKEGQRDGQRTTSHKPPATSYHPSYPSCSQLFSSGPSLPPIH